MLRLIHWLASRLPHRLITGEDNSPYLSRFKLFGWMPGDTRRWPIGVYLHRFHRPDNDDALHNHPWKWAFSLVLVGGYMEALPNGKKRVRLPWSWRVLKANSYHSITTILDDTWTLFIVGPKASSWGFWVPGRGHVPWRERLAERGVEVPHA